MYSGLANFTPQKLCSLGRPKKIEQFLVPQPVASGKACPRSSEVGGWRVQGFWRRVHAPSSFAGRGRTWLEGERGLTEGGGGEGLQVEGRREEAKGLRRPCKPTKGSWRRASQTLQPDERATKEGLRRPYEATPSTPHLPPPCPRPSTRPLTTPRTRIESGERKQRS